VGLLLLFAGAISFVPLTVFLVASVVVWRRRHRSAPLVVPAVIAGIAFAALVFCVAAFLSSAVQFVGKFDPATKATVLSLGISEAANCTAFFLLAGTPLLIAAWLLDRWLRKRG
jgi:hypothetical protein